MGRMKDLVIDALNAAAEAERKAFDEYFNSAIDEEEQEAFAHYVFDPEDEEYLDAESHEGYYR